MLVGSMRDRDCVLIIVPESHQEEHLEWQSRKKRLVKDIQSGGNMKTGSGIYERVSLSLASF